VNGRTRREEHLLGPFGERSKRKTTDQVRGARQESLTKGKKTTKSLSMGRNGRRRGEEKILKRQYGGFPVTIKGVAPMRGPILTRPGERVPFSESRKKSEKRFSRRDIKGGSNERGDQFLVRDKWKKRRLKEGTPTPELMKEDELLASKGGSGTMRRKKTFERRGGKTALSLRGGAA